MRYVMYAVGIIVILAIAFLAWIRFAPADVGKWHVPVTAETSRDMTGGAIRILKVDADALSRVDTAARALPRTHVVAGSVGEGRVTYETRSRIVGFPDYTTVEYSDGLLRMHARLRFGRSDFGVNAKRLQLLLVAAEG